MKKIMVFFIFIFLLMPIRPFAEQPKVYTDSDLEDYKSGSEDDTYQFNKENYKNQRQQEMIENYRIEKDSLNRQRKTDLEKQKRINAERQKKIDECVEKAQAMIEESTKAKYRAGANAKLRAGQAMLDSCYGRSSATSEESTGPLIPIGGGSNFIDTSTGKVRNCPKAIGKPTLDIDRDCLPE
jgi:hypothetical protein